MKTKKFFCLSLIFSVIFSANFSTVFSICQAEESQLLKKLDFEDFFQEKTPLEFSMRSMKEFFKSNSIPSLRLKGRSDGINSKTSCFNESFMSYLKEAYNRRGYAQNISQDGAHIVEFLELGNEINLDISTVYVGMRLFLNKIKSSDCELIDDTVVRQILAPMPGLLERYFNDEINKNNNYINISFIRKHTEETMLTAFTEHLTEFQHQPGVFLSNISDNIAEFVKKEFLRIDTSRKKQEEIIANRERLRQIIIRFFEIALNKLIWNTQAHEGIWNSFVSISNNLQLLGSHSIIDHMDDLDDLLWSLVHRFCYFMDLVGSSLPIEFYEEIESDLIHKVIYFLEVKEQDDGIKTKKETLLEALIHAKTKAVAFQQGIISEPLSI